MTFISFVEYLFHLLNLLVFAPYWFPKYFIKYQKNIKAINEKKKKKKCTIFYRQMYSTPVSS